MVQNGASSFEHTERISESGSASRSEIAIRVAFVAMLLALFAVAASVLWVAEPVALLALPIPFSAILILLVVVHDRHLAHGS